MSTLTSWLSLVKPAGPELAGSPTGPTVLNTNYDTIDDHIAGMERYAEMHITADQAIPNTTLTTPNWTAKQDELPVGLVDLANDRFVIPDAGVWMFLLNIYWDVNATGVRNAVIQSNTTGFSFGTDMRSSVATFNLSQQVIGIKNCALNEQIVGKISQTSGGALNLMGLSAALRSTFQAMQLKSL